MFDVCIVGAGVVGALCARELSAYKLSVCVVDRANDVCTGASRANSAIVHAGFDAKPGTLKARFNVRGSEMMEQVCRDLGVKYVRNGSLVLGYTDEDKATLAELYERGEYTPLTKEEYVSLAVSALELLPPDTVVARITGDGNPDDLLAPDWSRKKVSVINDIDKLLYELGTYQGRKNK